MKIPGGRSNEQDNSDQHDMRLDPGDFPVAITGSRSRSRPSGTSHALPAIAGAGFLTRIQRSLLPGPPDGNHGRRGQQMAGRGKSKPDTGEFHPGSDIRAGQRIESRHGMQMQLPGRYPAGVLHPSGTRGQAGPGA